MVTVKEMGVAAVPEAVSVAPMLDEPKLTPGTLNVQTNAPVESV